LSAISPKVSRRLGLGPDRPITDLLDDSSELRPSKRLTPLTDEPGLHL
jgi:hypothetical protein